MYSLKRNEKIIAGLLFVTVFLGYIYTITPTLPFWDCGEFIATAYSLGVPHPPGTPLMVLIGNLFIRLFFFVEEIAVRVNLMSAVSSATAAMFMYIILIKFFLRINPQPKLPTRIINSVSAFAAALAGSFFYSVWLTSVEAEVYAPSTGITLLLIWLTLVAWDKLNEDSEDKYVMLVIYLAMLSIGMSLAPLLMLPGAVIFLVWVGWKKHKDLSVSLVAFSIFFAFLYLAITKESLMLFIVGSILTTISVTLCDYISKDVKVNYRKVYTYLTIYIGLAILGLSPHLILIIRARANPYINIAAPTTFRGLWDVFNREQYGPLVLLPRQTDNGIGTFAALFEQFKMFFKYYTWQFGGYFRNEIADPTALMRIVSSLLMAVFTATGLYGIYVHFKKDKKTFIFIMITLFLLSVGLIVYLNMKYSPSDPVAAHQPREVRERDYFYMPAYFMFMAFFAFGLRELIVSFKSKTRELKERFSPGLFTLPQWILLALVVLIAVSPFFANINSYVNRRNNWIADEYAKNMLNTPRPNSIIFTNGDNDTYPLWFEQVVRDYRTFEPGEKGVLVVNLSLLNVDWYIKQMQSFGVPISMTDREIEQLRPVRLQNNEILMIRDIVIRDIIHTNSTGRKTPRSLLYASRNEFNEKVLTDYSPDSINIYFSVTVSEDARSKYRENLILEGLAYRITSDSEAGQYPRNVDVETTKENIWQKYSYDYILNEDIYVDENVDRIMTNYAAGFLQLGIYYSEIDSLRKAVKHFRQGRKFYTYDRNSVTMNIARVLIEMEEYEEAEEEIRKTMGNSDDPRDKATMTAVLSEIYLSKGDYERAEEIYDSILKKNPEEPAGYAGKLRIYKMKGEPGKYENTKSILMRNPNLLGNVIGFLYMQHSSKDILTDLLGDWLELRPEDSQAAQLLKEIEEKW